ncbi:MULTISPECIES: acetolactate synthase 2 catalytic subunit [unclassified Arsukibacterium]|uniref:acetolactate synthase 2 catalytic subunit n=1 Tax=unclassified Arsukibacterium TaxID=2635278 RepID=UPI000C58910D|nr:MULTISPECIES: acetolactate synthase 2 catalytic subunit [unclassified Arsukibacterium]MAA94560.1 acetolactate synthase 2 catalytic subunit [Rheinheimera sp.]MBM32857.1 acetolactate synthase 2 catalytic subunit [Rheinheimera sp.]|tara:strand:+ start:38957 stop:40606 length:1650 start_codon:yes stop_codon:yes gene_type:complete
MNGAELVLKVLQQQGVDTIFGYPGGAIMPIYDAIYASPVKHYLCRHEQGGAFSAIGYARSSGKVGVCLATSGPGATNLITSLADAMLDSVPLVAITGQVSQAVMGTDAFQEIDVLGLSLSVTKHSFMVRSADELAATLNEAFAIARSGRPGPVLVDIPKDVQLAAAAEPSDAASPQSRALNTSLAQSGPARQLIANASKPMAYIGGGVHMAGAMPQLQDFLTQCPMPSVTTLKGMGSVAKDNPYYLGMLGMHGTQAANLAVQQCDLLVCLGARFDDRVTGNLQKFAPNAKVIHVDIDPAEINKVRFAEVSFLGDMRQILPAIASSTDCSDWLAHCSSLKLQHGWRYDHPGERIYAPLLLKQLSERMPDNSVVCCDVGQHQMWVAQHMRFSHPRNHLSSGGLGTMGFGLPAAIGAKLARPQDTVIAVSGDGSFMMNVQELGTIKRFRLPVKIVIIDNQRLGMVKQWQQLFFNERYSETDLSDNPDFVALAAAFAIPGHCITRKDEVESALEAMFTWPGPYLLHVRIDEKDNVWPLVPPGAANEDMIMESN